MNYDSGPNVERILNQSEKILREVSRIPYNNAASIYSAASIEPDSRMGGSCLYKLATLKEKLSLEGVSNIFYITSLVGKTTHYALIGEINGVKYYFDPFLWQGALLPLDKTVESVPTLQRGWSLRVDTQANDVLTISLVAGSGDEAKTLISHNYTQALDYLPSPSALPMRPNLPSFMMQVPGNDGVTFYKIWFSKRERTLTDIWIEDTQTGERRKIERLSNDRESTIGDIETIVGASKSQMEDYFTRAHELEVELSQLISNGDDNLQH